MPVYQFGSGTLFATPFGGSLAANPTPTQFGTLQDVSLEISFDTKELYGSSIFPEMVARGKGKIAGKAKFARLNGKQLNDLFFGQSMASGQTLAQLDEANVVPNNPGPYTVTVVPPSSGTFVEDQGVRYSTNGIPLVRVASAPAQGQYSASVGGVYTFASADAQAAVLISYTYSVAASGKTISISNQLLGVAPTFTCVLRELFNSQQTNVKLYSCIGSKLTRATKQDDFLVEEFDFAAFANATGKVIDFYDAE
jgi:hypothetical protein